MKNFGLYLSVFLVIIVFGCQMDNIEPMVVASQMRAEYRDPSDLPDVLAHLNNSLNEQSNIRGSVSNGQVVTSIGKIDIDRIFEVIDTLSNTNYTFLVDDEDGNPFTFTNLVIKKRENGDFEMPYLIEYTVDSAHISDFVANDFSMTSFTGKTRRRYLQNFSFSQRSEANLGERSPVSTQCEIEGNFQEGTTVPNPSTGGGGGRPITDPSPTNSGGGGGGIICIEFFEVIETDPCGWETSPTTGLLRPDFCGQPKTKTVSHVECFSLVGAGSANDGEICPEPETGDIGVLLESQFREKALRFLLENNPYLLLNIPCSEIEKWKKVAEHKPDIEVVNKLKELTENNHTAFGFGFDIQELSDPKSPTVNMDYFSVTITELPNNMTGTGFLNYIRKNINNFIDTNLSSFEPYNLTPTNTNESAIWNSNNPIGAIVHIDIPGDDASVVCSDYTDEYWRFSTITSPADYTHPVSGTREFGFYKNPDASYTFYTRGVDRLTIDLQGTNNSGVLAFGDLIMKKIAFSSADNLWKSFQERINDYVNSNGGYGYKNSPLIYRPDYRILERVLSGELPISALGCD